MNAANATPGLSLAGLGLGYKVLTGRQGRKRVLVKTTCSVRVLAEIFLRKMCIWFLPKSTLRESRKVSLFFVAKDLFPVSATAACSYAMPSLVFFGK